MLPLLVMMNSEAQKMVLFTASTTFRNISVCQSSQKLHPPSKSPRTGACFYSEAHFCLRSFNGLLISIIKKFLIQIFRFFYNILGLSCSKLLCFDCFKLYSCLFSSCDDPCSKYQGPQDIAMHLVANLFNLPKSKVTKDLKQIQQNIMFACWYSEQQ